MQRLSRIVEHSDCLDAERQSKRGPEYKRRTGDYCSRSEFLRCVASQLTGILRTGKPWGSWHEVLVPELAVASYTHNTHRSGR